MSMYPRSDEVAAMPEPKRARRRPALDAIAQLVASGLPHEEAARQAGVSQRVLSRHKEAIDRRVIDLRSEIAGNALNRLSGALERAVKTLDAALTDEQATPATRARAAVALINQFVSLREHGDLAQRIAEMERHIQRGEQ